MRVFLNEREIEVKDDCKLNDLIARHEPQADVIIVNGIKTNENIRLTEKDHVVLIVEGQTPNEDAFESNLIARHTQDVHEHLKKGRIVIAGLGGLGSNAALALARSGVGHLLLVDFDVVEPSNLNRQAYFIEQIGLPKVDALEAIIKKVNPFVQIEKHNIMVDAQNIETLFKNADIVIEAFDRPDTKAMLVNTVLQKLPKTFIIAGSGMAGYFSNNIIKTKKLMKRLYVVGDGVNEAKRGCDLMASRVLIAAGHQANMAVRILLQEFEI